MLKQMILVVALLFMVPFSYADQANDDPKYDGIEISVNINTASAQELADLLKGVGLKKAQAIVEYRQEHGTFESAEALTKVKGIGPALVSKNQSRIQL